MWDCCTTALMFRVCEFHGFKIVSSWRMAFSASVSNIDGQRKQRRELKMDTGATEFPPVYAHWLTPHYYTSPILCCSVSTVSNVSSGSAVLTTQCQIKNKGRRNKLPCVWLKLMMMFARLNSPRRSSAESKKARGGPSYWSITSVGLLLWMLLFHSSWTHYEFCRAFLKGPTTLYLAQSRHKSVQTVSNVGSRWTEIGSLVKSWNTNTTTTSCAKKDSRSSFFCFNDGSSVAHAPPAKQHTTTPAAPLHHTAHTVVVVV